MSKRIISILLSIMMCITILPIMAFADGGASAKAYAVLDSDGTMTIGCWDKKPDGAYEVPNLGGKENEESIPWRSKSREITKVVFDASIKAYKPTSTSYWFYDCAYLRSVENANYLDTSSVTDMEYMFSSCSGLYELDISQWDTSSVMDMSSMFAGCFSLESIDLSSWDTSSLIFMRYMFSWCSKLNELDISGWDTSSVTDMMGLFWCCTSLKSLDLSGWNTSSVMQMYQMFYKCSSLTTVDLSGWDFSSVTYDGRHYCFAISGMFENCTNLKIIHADKDWNLSDIAKENSYDVFMGCTSLTGSAGTAYKDIYNSDDIYNSGGVCDTDYARIDGGELKPGYLSLGYRMSFNIGEGAIGEAPESIFVITGDRIKLPFSSDFSKSGYKFIGWSDGTKTYAESAIYEAETKDVEFIAVWEKCSHEHTEVKDAKAATSTTEGYTGDTYCTDCGAKVADGKAIPALTPEPTPTNSPKPTGGAGNGGSGNGSGVVIPTPTTPPPQKPTGNATKSAGEFVERCYNVCLGRSSDEAGFRYWLDMLNSGDSCGAEVGYGFVFSAEYMMKNTSNEQFVNDMYSMFFGREADAEGFNSWVEQLNNGVSRLQVYAGFASSPEFTNLCGEYGIIGVSILNDDAINAAGDVGKFVGRLYKICLSRYPDYCGFTAWTKGLQEGSKTGSTCAYGFIFSGEFMSRGLSNEEFVVYMYKVFFDREADEAGYNLWLSVLNNGGSYEEVFNGFTGSPEFAVLCASYGINA